MHSRDSRGRTARGAVILLGAIMLPAGSDAAGRLVPQHSEDLRPVLTQRSKASSASLEFAAFGRAFRVRLTRNQGLERHAAGSSLQLYKGALDGVPGSWARISVVNGLPRGMIWDGREMFIVDAAPADVNYGAAGTVMYKLSDAVMEQGVSLAGDTVETPRGAAATHGDMVGGLRARMRASQAGIATHAVEISVLGDEDFVARFQSEAQARDALLVRMNNVDGIFSAQVGVELRVVTVDIAGELTENLSANTDANALLDELGRVRLRIPELSATGLTHLFTGRPLDGNTAGVAYELALCSSRFSASLSESLNNVVLDSLITAHEIGHVFGAPHDGTEECASTPQGQYIMTPTLNSSVTSFSQCSLDQFDAVIDSYSCVVDLPPPGPQPSPPAPPEPPSADGGNGGGGVVDPVLLLLTTTLGAWSGIRRTLRTSTRRS